MKPWALIIVTIFLCSGCASKNPKVYWRNQHDQLVRLVTELGVVYVGMPRKDLPRVGYTRLMQRAYHRKDNEEWITFLNWPTKRTDVWVTFYIVDGKIRGWKERFK